MPTTAGTGTATGRARRQRAIRPAIRLGLVTSRRAAECADQLLCNHYGVASTFFIAEANGLRYTYALETRAPLTKARQAELTMFVAGVEAAMRWTA